MPEQDHLPQGGREGGQGGVRGGPEGLEGGEPGPGHVGLGAGRVIMHPGGGPTGGYYPLQEEVPDEEGEQGAG